MNVPDYVSPVVAYRAWRLEPLGLMSFNGEFWHPNQTLEAVCKRSVYRFFNRHRPPHGNCSCGIYAAKSFDHLRGIGYADRGGVRGEVYLWGTVVEHKLGWRAQFAYPKTLVVPESLLFGRLESLKILIEYGADLFVAGENGNVLLWTKQCGGFDHVREVAASLQLAKRRSTAAWWTTASDPVAVARACEIISKVRLRECSKFVPAPSRLSERWERFAAAEAQAKEIYQTHLRAIQVAAIASGNHQACRRCGSGDIRWDNYSDVNECLHCRARQNGLGEWIG
jgi:hypothetical protein